MFYHYTVLNIACNEIRCGFKRLLQLKRGTNEVSYPNYNETDFQARIHPPS